MNFSAFWWVHFLPFKALQRPQRGTRSERRNTNQVISNVAHQCLGQSWKTGSKPPEFTGVGLAAVPAVSGLAVKARRGRKCWSCGKEWMGCACSPLPTMGPVRASLGSCPPCGDTHLLGTCPCSRRVKSLSFVSSVSHFIYIWQQEGKQKGSRIITTAWGDWSRNCFNLSWCGSVFVVSLEETQLSSQPRPSRTSSRGTSC